MHPIYEVIAFLLQTTLNFQTFLHQSQSKNLSELATLNGYIKTHFLL